MNRWMLSSAALTILACAGVAGAQPVEQDGIGRWALEPASARCVISRRFGTGDEPVTVGFKATPVGDALQIVVLRTGYRKITEQMRAEVTIDGREIQTTALSYPLDPRGRRVAHLISLSGEDAAALRGARAIDLHVKEGINRSFSLDGIAGAWSQLEACLKRLRRDWNLDETQGTRIAASPQPLVPIPALFSDADYPRAALRADQSGVTGFLLLLDEKGTVRDCTLVSASGIASLDTRTCGIIIQRGKFKPAVDVDGKPAKGAIQSRIRWVVAH